MKMLLSEENLFPFFTELMKQPGRSMMCELKKMNTVFLSQYQSNFGNCSSRGGDLELKAYRIKRGTG